MYTFSDVRVLACKLVDLWLRIVRGDDSAPSTSEAGQPMLATSPSEFSKLNTEDAIDGEAKVETTDISGSEGHLPVYKITIRDGKKVLAEISGGQRLSSEAMEEGSSTGTEDIHQEEGESVEDEVDDIIDNDDDDDEDYVVKPVKLRKKPPIKSNKQSIARKPAKVRGSTKKERESTDSGSSAGKSPNHQKAAVKPAPKKIKNDQQKVKSNVKNKSSSVVDDDHKSENANIKSNIVNNDTEKLVNAKPKGKINLSLKNKTNAKLTKEKERNDKKIDKFDIKEKKMLENSDKSKKKVESYDSLTDKEKESLSKFITPPISKLGKIPKKSAANKEEKQSEEKNRTLKEETTDNKSELKKASDTKKLPEVKRPEKKYSMSVGLKRSLPNESRPKTVKTYNSKFRSTGLEEEVKPPPSKAVPKKPTTSPFSSPLSLLEKKSAKRSSPPPPDITIPEKKPKIDPTIEEKKPTEKVGGIKLIPPKPKRKSNRITFFNLVKLTNLHLKVLFFTFIEIYNKNQDSWFSLVDRLDLAFHIKLIVKHNIINIMDLVIFRLTADILLKSICGCQPLQMESTF